MQLRQHQEEAVQSLRHSFATGHRRPLLQAPTGWGKTITAANIINSALDKGKRVLFVVDRITLIEQTSEAFDKLGLDHAIIQGDHYRTNSAMALQIGSVQTITRRYRVIENHFDLIIVDEAHAQYASFTKMITEGQWKNVPIIGLSATPWSASLGKTYDELVISGTTSWLMDKGYLSKYTAYGPSAPDLKGVRTVAGDYNQKDLSEACNKPKIIGDIVQTWLQRGDNRQTVCFAVDVLHSKSIVDAFNERGIPAAHIDAHTDEMERKRILHLHSTGEIMILSNVGITTKGWDSPGTSCLIYGRPTKSLMLHIQIMGRVLRVSPCGRDAIILDHGRNISRLGFPDDDMPQFLCNGDADTRKKKMKHEEKLPKPCPKCTHLTTSYPCPSCGFKPSQVSKIKAEAGDLQKLRRSETPMVDKDRWYGMMLGYARSKGWKDGSASHMYRQRFGVWPARKTGVHPTQPDQEVTGYIQHLNIKRARSA